MIESLVVGLILFCFIYYMGYRQGKNKVQGPPVNLVGFGYYQHIIIGNKYYHAWEDTATKPALMWENYTSARR